MPPILPNIDQAAPAQVGVRTVDTQRGRAHRLGFTSRVVNDGRGPLIIRSTRTGDEVMRADQVLELRGGGLRTRRGVGSVRYVRRGGHQHWHVMGLQRFELRTPAGRRLPRRVAKQGLCLGDREPARKGTSPRTPTTANAGRGAPASWPSPRVCHGGGATRTSRTWRDRRSTSPACAAGATCSSTARIRSAGIAESDESDNAASVRHLDPAPRVPEEPRASKVLRSCRDRARC